ncbi:protein RIC-3b [Amphiprion ocellaris]|uniref:Resistance to inhibitors of cholinesterase protein 3 N-terminal domain-containing protein n=1 Tax=Amphiprion ocellaris TaxID=80972 RepID=A0A3Q1BW07_AMPOC|nr:protein RIC-3b [Amphiprion ocellaris]
MAMSTFQKVTLATCLVLCVALLLPKMLLSRGRKDAGERPEGSGRFPPMVHRQMAAESRGQKAAGSGFSRAHNSEAIARAKGAGTGAGAGGKSNLAGQIIPVYGFGILLYILYILFKITSKGSSKPSEARFPSVRSENMKRKITDFELAQLQEKLRETELVMENIVSNAHHSPDRVKGVTVDQEESLLQQLTEITRVMQEGQLVEGMAPEKKPQDDWEDYPEEPQPYWEPSHCCCQHGEQQHSPHREPEADETETKGTNLADSRPEDVIGEAEDLSNDAVRESDLIAASEEGVGPQRDLGGNEQEEANEHKEGEDQIDLGVPEEDLAGVLKELEFTLKMATMMEQERIEDLTRPTETSSSLVRRRNKRRRAKKAVH